MEITHLFLQHYWWFIISLLCGILVFMLFVQGGQTLLYTIAKTDAEQTLLVNSLGMQWELTFTTLVTFGGAFFASFPLFYSTSFSGAFYVWMAILFFFVIQAVSYEFRSKPANLLGKQTYGVFLLLNGLMGTLLLGTVVGTLFTGAHFLVDPGNITAVGKFNTISTWHNPWRGLEALSDYRNVSLGLAVFFLSRVLAIQYFYNNVKHERIRKQAKKPLIVSSCLFLVFFLTFFISLLFSYGWEYDAQGVVSMVKYKYFYNFMEMPLVMVLFLIGVVAVLASIGLAIFRTSRSAIWFGGIGTILTVTMLMGVAGYNHTAYYPSLVDAQNSLTIENSSSSEFTLRVMMYVSFIIPFVVAYIWHVWRSLTRKPMSEEMIKENNLKY